MQNEANQNINSNKNESKNILHFVFLFIILIAFEQLTKFLAENIFRNYYFAFSLPLPVWLMYLVYTAIFGVMVIYCLKSYENFSKLQSIAWLLIFSGAVSNIGERIIFGYVRDWIYILSGIFNLADLYIVAGILLLLFQQSIEKNEHN